MTSILIGVPVAAADAGELGDDPVVPDVDAALLELLLHAAANAARLTVARTLTPRLPRGTPLPRHPCSFDIVCGSPLDSVWRVHTRRSLHAESYPFLCAGATVEWHWFRSCPSSPPLEAGSSTAADSSEPVQYRRSRSRGCRSGPVRRPSRPRGTRPRRARWQDSLLHTSLAVFHPVIGDQYSELKRRIERTDRAVCMHNRLQYGSHGVQTPSTGQGPAAPVPDKMSGSPTLQLESQFTHAFLHPLCCGPDGVDAPDDATSHPARRRLEVTTCG